MLYGIYVTAGTTVTYNTYSSGGCFRNPSTVSSGSTLTPCSSPTLNGAYGYSTVSISSSAARAPAGSNSCFSGSEAVTLLSGESRAISDIRIGDQVLASDTAGKVFFSEVIFVPHGRNEESAVFTHIFTANGRDLKMTQNHILPAGFCGSPLPLVYASQVNEGDCILTVSGEEKVSKVEITQGEGVYTIVTNEEFIVVNGIIASPFGANHFLANLLYNVYRFIHTSVPVLRSSRLFHRMLEVSILQQFIPFTHKCSYNHSFIYKTIINYPLTGTGRYNIIFRVT